MKKICSFIKKEPVLIIALAVATVSCFFVPPDAEYIEYIDFRTLALLYSLMIVVAGLRKAKVFAVLADVLCVHAKNIRTIGTLLVCLSFFCSMLITNDVALLTFVPFAVTVLGMAGRKKDLIRVIVLQTVAANLGSALTPVGNPQNLYLYSFYNISFFRFLTITFPVWILSLFLLLGCCFSLPKVPIETFSKENAKIDRKALFLYLVLFGICLLTVIRILPWPLMLLTVMVTVLIFDRKMLLKGDFMLLLTFVCFFVFAGNFSRTKAVGAVIKKFLSGKEYFTALLVSQVISNVPAALLLSNFTDNAKALLLGVNIGGLGTPIASLASLIGLKLYARTEHACTGRFLLEFTAVNLLLLFLLSIFRFLIS